MKNKFTKALLFTALLFGSVVAFAQQTPLSGVVLDETGQAMPGVNIVEKGTKNSASTDFDGKFILNTTKNLPFQIEITALGFGSKKVSITCVIVYLRIVLSEALLLNR